MSNKGNKKIHKALKTYFIPHQENDYLPHIFRELSVVIILSVVVLFFVVSAGSTFILRNTDLGSAVLPAVLVDLANEDRLDNGESALVRNPVLDSAAQMKANDMSAKGYFAHTSPEGLTPWHWFREAGYSFIYAGENLAVDFTESQDVENAWLNSPTHRANLLNARFTEVGIATAQGSYKGSPTTFVVQMFGTPLVLPSSTPVETPVAVPPVPKEVPEEIVIAPTPASAVSAPTVAGEEITVVEEKLETIIDTEDFAVVKNTEAEIPVQTSENLNTEVQKYSTWSDRLLFNSPSFTDKIFRIILGVIFIGLILMIFIEIKKQHPKNIIYGVLIFFILLVLLYLNHAIFVTHTLL